MEHDEKSVKNNLPYFHVPEGNKSLIALIFSIVFYFNSRIFVLKLLN